MIISKFYNPQRGGSGQYLYFSTIAIEIILVPAIDPYK